MPDDFRYQRIQRLHERFVSASEEFPTFSFALISTDDEELRPFLLGDTNVQIFPSRLLRMKPSRTASEWFHSSLEILAWAWIQWHKIHAPEQCESVRDDIGSLDILNSDVDWESAIYSVPNWISILTRLDLSNFETVPHRNFEFFSFRLQRTIVAGLLSDTLLIGPDSVDSGFERIDSQESEAIFVHFDPYISDISSDSRRNKRMMELSAVALDELAVEPIKQFTPPPFALDRSAIWIEEICSQTLLNEIHFGPFLIRYPTSNVFNLSAHYLEKRMKPTDEVEWSRLLSPSEWEELLNLSWKTIKKRAERGSYRTQHVTSKSVRIAIEDLPEPVRSVVR